MKEQMPEPQETLKKQHEARKITGWVVFRVSGVVVSRRRYKSKSHRQQEIKRAQALISAREYTITIIPDQEHENE